MHRWSALFCDETPMPVLAPGHVKLRQFWRMRPTTARGRTCSAAVAYVFAGGRSKKEIASQLSGFTGILQVDGYAAYKALVKDERAESRHHARLLPHSRTSQVRRSVQDDELAIRQRGHRDDRNGLCDREAHSRQKRRRAARYPAGETKPIMEALHAAWSPCAMDCRKSRR